MWIFIVLTTKFIEIWSYVLFIIYTVFLNKKNEQHSQKKTKRCWFKLAYRIAIKTKDMNDMFIIINIASEKKKINMEIVIVLINFAFTLCDLIYSTEYVCLNAVIVLDCTLMDLISSSWLVSVIVCSFTTTTAPTRNVMKKKLQFSSLCLKVFISSSVLRFVIQNIDLVWVSVKFFFHIDQRQFLIGFEPT